MAAQGMVRSCRLTGGHYAHGSFPHVVHLYLHVPQRLEKRVLAVLFRMLPDALRWFGEMLTEFSVHTEAVLRAAGRFSEVLQAFEQKWLNVGVTLLNNGLPNEAGEVFSRWYQFVRESELEHRKQYKKGTVLWWIGQSRRALRRDDESKNWFLLAMLEDVRINQATWHTLPARDSLVKGLQIAAAVVDELGREAAALCESRPWSPTEPESVWLALKPHKRRFTRAPIPFLKGLAAQMMTSLSLPGATRVETGDSLERLVTYLFATEQGFEVVGPSRAPDAQHDILIRNNHHDAAVSGLGDYLLVECKNWSTKNSRAGNS